MLPVDASENDVETAERCHKVGDHLAVRHFVERGEVVEIRGTDFEACRFRGSVGADVESEFTFCRFGGPIGLRIGRWFESAWDIRLYLTVVLRPVGEQFDTLVDNLGGFFDLFEANEHPGALATGPVAPYSLAVSGSSSPTFTDRVCRTSLFEIRSCSSSRRPGMWST